MEGCNSGLNTVIAFFSSCWSVSSSFHTLFLKFSLCLFFFLLCVCFPPPLLFSMFSPSVLLCYHCYVGSCQPVSCLNLPVASGLRNSACRLVVTLAYTTIWRWWRQWVSCDREVAIRRYCSGVDGPWKRETFIVFFCFFVLVLSSFVPFVWFFLPSPVSPYLEVFHWIKRRSWLLVCRLY